MTTITLRTNKNSALTAGELDGNFTTLGLADGMTTSNVAIGVNTVTATTGTITTNNVTTLNVADVDVSSKIVINETLGDYPNAKFVCSSPAYDSNLVIRTSGAVAGNIALTYQREHDGNAEAGIGVGFFSQFKATDVTTAQFLGRVEHNINNFTDNDDYDTKFRISTYTNVAGTQTEVFPITIEHDNIEANAPVQLKSYSNTERNALTNLVNGQLIYNTDTNKVQARVEGAWVDLH